MTVDFAASDFLTIDFILSQSVVLNENVTTSITVRLLSLFIGVADTCHALPVSRIKTVIVAWSVSSARSRYQITGAYRQH